MLPAADHVGPPSGAGVESMPDAPVPIRPMQLRELLDRPFGVVQARIKPLAAMAGAGAAVAAVIAFGVTALVSLATGDSDLAVAVAAVLTSLLCAWLLRLYIRGVSTAVALSVVHRQPLGWRAALRRVAARLGPLALYQTKYTLIGIGVLALGTPLMITLPLAVIWLGSLRARRYPTAAIVFEESASARVATQRSKTLVSGAEWQLVWVWLYLRALFVMLLLPLVLFQDVVADITGTQRWTVTALIITAVMGVVAFAETIESATQVVVYVDRRCRREAWDIRIPRAGGGVR
ncbi:hypothetical protein [Nocardia sp. NPDC050406]|uniref:hypothetical protein n=1 Tax=Nocardia sp. NPDC050406 TaxID=3364318 RepID=UPI00379053BF